jgi:hypothetical protein
MIDILARLFVSVSKPFQKIIINIDLVMDSIQFSQLSAANGVPNPNARS